MKILVNIDVPELGPAIDFYTAALPLKLSRILDEDVAELTGASSIIYLLRNAAGSHPTTRPADVRRYARHWTPVHLDFVVDDLAEAAKRATNAGALPQGESVEWMESKCLTFADPFGHGFCLIAFSGDTYGDRTA
jgi:hypothetical protein